MNQAELLALLGFWADPFHSADAEYEDNLRDYFLRKTYFESVWGDPAHPRACVVLAARGAGKTAQRRMVEERAQTEDVFVIPYTRFEPLAPAALADLRTDYHLRNVLRIGTLRLLAEIYERQLPASAFGASERENLVSLFQEYLAGITHQNVGHTIDDLKTIPTKAREWLTNWRGPISSAAGALLKSKGLPLSVDLGASGLPTRGPGPNVKLQFDWFKDFVVSIGFRATYILVDRVDETDFTGNDASASFQLVKPLLRDLELLAGRNHCFKFFLWEAVLPYYREFSRPDRVDQYPLAWKPGDIRQILSDRLRAFSKSAVSSLDDLVSPKSGTPLDGMVVRFSQNSPRDLIRAGKQIVAEHLKHKSDKQALALETSLLGLTSFSAIRARELADEPILLAFRKMKRVSFNARDLGRLLEIGESEAGARISAWVERGLAVALPGEGAQSGLFAQRDLRVAHATFPEMTIQGFLFGKVRDCEACGTSVIRDWNLYQRSTCHECGNAVFESARPIIEGPGVR